MILQYYIMENVAIKTKKVNRNTNISSLKRVTRKLKEVSRFSRAKQLQGNKQKCGARAKLLFFTVFVVFTLSLVSLDFIDRWIVTSPLRGVGYLPLPLATVTSVNNCYILRPPHQVQGMVSSLRIKLKSL